MSSTAPSSQTSSLSAIALICGILAFLVVTPATAAASRWIHNNGGKVRIVATPPSADGSIRAAVIIDLKPGWTTYWRNPGESGVPPQLGIAGSSNIRSAELLFPPPRLLDEGGVPAIGYARSVAFPLSIRQSEAGRASVLKADLFIGVCKQICIPVSASYSLDIVPGPTGKSGPAAVPVAVAFAALPQAESHDFAIEAVTPAAGGKELLVKVRLPQAPSPGPAPQLFAAGPHGWSFGAGRLVNRKESAAEFAVPVLSTPDGKSLPGEKVELVVTSGTRSIEASKIVD